MNLNRFFKRNWEIKFGLYLNKIICEDIGVIRIQVFKLMLILNIIRLEVILGDSNEWNHTFPNTIENMFEVLGFIFDKQVEIIKNETNLFIAEVIVDFL